MVTVASTGVGWISSQGVWIVVGFYWIWILGTINNWTLLRFQGYGSLDLDIGFSGLGYGFYWTWILKRLVAFDITKMHRESTFFQIKRRGRFDRDR